MAKTHAPLAFFFLLVLAAAFITRPVASATCGFNIYVQTGNRNDAGTDTTVSLVISSGGGGSQLTLPNLRNYGTMGGSHDYFEKGRLDHFYVTSECLPGPPCWMMLSHDNTNNKPGWYVDYVLVVTNNGQHHFNVYQWLARDESPHQLVVVRNDCGRVVQGLGGAGDRSSRSMVPVRTSSVPTTSPKLPIAAAAAEEATTTHQIHDGDAAAAKRSTGSSGGEEQHHEKPAP